MQQTRREQFRDDTREEIKAIAHRHMAAQGTASLSLRAIARELGVSAPALYRYFANRDDLITALILDAFNALADAMDAAGKSKPSTDYAGRLAAIFMGYRAWALEHPTDFQLIYGNPIPDYHAPADVTGAASARSFVPIVEAIMDASQAGAMNLQSSIGPLSTGLKQELRQKLARNNLPISEEALYFAVEAWATGHGLIMLELFHHLQPVVGDVETFYRFEIETLLKRVGLPIQL